MTGVAKRAVALAILLAVLGAAAGAMIGLQRSSAYVATATILVDPLEGNPFFPSGGGGDLLNLETEAQLVASSPVASLVAERLHTKVSPEQLLAGLSVSVRPNTQILDIEYTAALRAVAAARAQAFAEVFLEFRKARAQASRFDRRATIEDQLKTEIGDLSRLIKERQRVGARSSQAALFTEQIRAQTSYVGELRAQLAEYEGGGTDPGQVVTPATVGSPGLLQSPTMLAVVGMLAGAALALAVRLLFTPAGGHVRHEADLETSDQPVLGSVTPGEIAGVDEALESKQPQVDVGQGFKKLRVSLLTREKRRPVSILVTRANARGTFTPAAGMGLAVATAMAGLETALVDATGQRGSVNLSIARDHAAGLTELILGEVSVDEALVPIARNLTFVPTGAIRTDIDDLLVNPELPGVVADLKKRSDVVILLGPPIQDAAAEALADVVDGVVVETHQGDRIRDFAEVQRAGAIGGSLLGMIYVGRSKRSSHSRSSRRGSRPRGASK